MKKQKNKVLKEGFMQAVLSLMFSQVLIKLLGLVYNLYLTNKDGFGDQGNAIYSGSYQIYALLLTLSSIGVPNAISKLVAERTAKGDHKGAIRIFKVALATFAIIGLVGTLLLFFGADIIATYWLNIPEAKYTLITLSPAVFFVTVAAVLRGYCNGKQAMRVTARSQTLEQVFKTVLVIIIVEIVYKMTNGNTVWMAAAAPVGGQILGEVLPYLELKQDKVTEEGEKEEVEMPEIRNKTVKEAKEILKELGLELEINNLTEEMNENETYVKEQIPKPGIKITKETKVYIDI